MRSVGNDQLAYRDTFGRCIERIEFFKEIISVPDGHGLTLRRHPVEARPCTSGTETRAPCCRQRYSAYLEFESGQRSGPHSEKWNSTVLVQV